MSDTPTKPRDTAIERTFAAQNNEAQRSWWLGNIRQNIEMIGKSHDVRCIQDVFWDVPGIIVGAGPSLDKNIHHLKEVWRKYPLFCCDRALKKLQARGITPQFTVTADASDDVAGFFEDADTRRTILITATYISPLVLRLPWKRVIFYNISDSDTGFTEAAVNLSSLGGHDVTVIPGCVIVGNIAFFCAKIAGCNPMTFIGNDLSMTTPSANPKDVSYKGTDPYGNEVYSLPGFLAGYEWLLNYLKYDQDFVRGKVKLYNSTEGGIMYSDEIEGLDLKDFIERRPGLDRSLNTMLQKHFEAYSARNPG